jgi:hypothetical protein
MTKIGFFAVLLIAAAPAARADCAADARETRSRLEEVKDAAKREEATKLLEKADKDSQAGRVWLCADAVKRVGQLLK